MESIVTAVMGRYFKFFIKNFVKDQFKLEVLKGSATLTNFQLNEDVLAELLHLPPCFVVKSAKVAGNLVLTVPFSNFRSAPITITIDGIDIEVVEPDELAQKQNLLAQLRSSNKDGSSGGSSTASEYVRDVTLDIKKVSLTLRTRYPGPDVSVDLANVVLQSTNGQWKVVPLTESRAVDTKSNVELLYKLLSVGSATVSTNFEGKKIPIIRPFPLSVQLTLKSSLLSSDKPIRAVQAVLNMDQFVLSWDTEPCKHLAEFAFGVGKAMARLVPKAPPKPNKALPPLPPPGGSASSAPALPAKALPPAPGSSSTSAVSSTTTSGGDSLEAIEFSFGLSIGSVVAEIKQSNTAGFLMSAVGLDMLVCAQRKIVSTAAALSPDEGRLESVFQVGVKMATLSELSPPKERDARFLQMVSQVPLQTQEGKDAAYFISTKVRHVWDPRGTAKREECELAVHGLQLLVDTRSWNGLREMLQMLVKQVDLKKGGGLGDMLGGGSAAEAGEELHNKVSSYWNRAWEIYKRSSIKLEATDLVLVVPTYAEFPALRSASLQLSVSRILGHNRADWSVVPYVEGVVAALPDDSHLRFTRQAAPDAHKLQLELGKVTLNLVDLTGSGPSRRLLEPCSVRLFSRYVHRHQDQQAPHQIEVCLHIGQASVRLTTNEYIYLRHLVESNIEYFKSLAAQHPHAVDTDALKHNAEKALSVIKKVATTVDHALSHTDTLGGVEPSHDPMHALRQALNYVTAVVLVRAERGTFKLPISAIAKETPTPAEMAAAAAAAATGDESDDSQLTEIGFDLIEALGENTGGSQGAIFRVGPFHANNIDNPRLPFIVSLAPASVAGGADASQHLINVVFQRKAPRQERAKGLARARVSGLKLTVVYKPGAAHELKELAPELRKLFKWATGKVKKNKDQLRQTLDQARGAAKEMAGTVQERVDLKAAAKEYLDIDWDLELADCVVLALDSPTADPAKPRLLFKLSNVNKEELTSKYNELQERLIQSKVALAQAEIDKDMLNSTLREYSETINKTKQQYEDRLTAQSAEQRRLETTLVEWKMKMVSIEADSDNLQSRVRFLEAKLKQHNIAVEPAAAPPSAAAKPLPRPPPGAGAAPGGSAGPAPPPKKGMFGF